jgi:hypothetical protein
MGSERVVGLEHFADVEGCGERPAGLHVLVEMGNVGGEHNPAAARMDPDELHPRRMAADRMQTYARS